MIGGCTRQASTVPEVARTRASGSSETTAALHLVGPDGRTASEASGSSEQRGDTPAEPGAPPISMPERPPEGRFEYEISNGEDSAEETVTVRWTEDGWTARAVNPAGDVEMRFKNYKGVTFALEMVADGESRCRMSPALPRSFTSGVVGDQVAGEARCGGVTWTSDVVIDALEVTGPKGHGPVVKIRRTETRKLKHLALEISTLSTVRLRDHVTIHSVRTERNPGEPDSVTTRRLVSFDPA